MKNSTIILFGTLAIFTIYADLLKNSNFSTDYEIIYQNCSEMIAKNEQIHRNFRKIPYRITFHCANKDYTKFTIHRKHSDKRKKLLTIDSYCNDSSSSFEPTNFLSLLRNKTMGFYGDSLTRQLFHALVAANLPYQSSYIPPKEHKGRRYSSSSYEQYNATILLCEDGFGDYMDRKEIKEVEYFECLEPVLGRSDYLLIGIAAWYKPYFRIPATEEPHFYKNYELSFKRFLNHLSHLRMVILESYQSTHYQEKYGRKSLSPPQLIWRSSPHAGCYEEMTLLHELLNNTNLTVDTIDHTVLAIGTHFNHRDGGLWTRLAYENNHTALWVKPYNAVIRNLSQQYKEDSFMDWYGFSMQFIQEVYGKEGIDIVHVDTLHYCVNGLHAASLLLLHDSLVDAVKKFRLKHVHH